MIYFKLIYPYFYCIFAEKYIMANRFITKAEDLITSHEQTRAGFIEAALEKNRKAKPYVEAASTLKIMASRASNPIDLLDLPQIRQSLLTASGLSDKSLAYFTEEDKIIAIKKLIEEFLVPAGRNFVDELVYRFLLIKGDSLGGTMRNFVGAVAKMKLTRKVLSVLMTMNIPCYVLTKTNKKKNCWESMSYERDYDNADEISAITWSIEGNNRVLFFDAKIPLVGKNVDICLYRGDKDDFNGGAIIADNHRAVMFGELKGGIDPAGADEHWKTGNTALIRIRTAFKDYDIKTAFVGAAIEKSMANEIWEQLTSGVLSNAANITCEEQFEDFSEWIVKL